MTFCGSYRPSDVTFLLKCLPQLPFVDVAHKEKLIQTGVRHYSEMLSPEALPSPRYLEVFRSACVANQQQMARDCLTLAALIASRRNGPITLVSLVRAGTPVGVILKHLLGQVLQDLGETERAVLREGRPRRGDATRSSWTCGSGAPLRLTG